MAPHARAEDCPADLLSEALAVTREDTTRGLERIDALLLDYGHDPRLHFLRGSLLASLQRYDEGRTAMGAALAIAPEYAIARYQLGFLELTSGDPATAAQTWSPLQSLAADNPLRLFAAGLQHLARDEFEPALALFREGMERNTQIPEINGDIRLIIGALQTLHGETPAADEPISAAHLLLQQYKGKSTKH